MKQSQCYHYSYQEFLKDIPLLAQKCSTYKPDIILAIARGAMTLAHFLSYQLNIRLVYTLNALSYDDQHKRDHVEIINIPHFCMNKKILIVDDIIDSGDTLQAVVHRLVEENRSIDYKIATLFYKKSALIQPDYSVKEARTWIDFFWETEPLSQKLQQ